MVDFGGERNNSEDEADMNDIKSSVSLNQDRQYRMGGDARHGPL